MTIFYSAVEASKIDSPCVVSIGNFDGVHLGHQSVVKQLLQKSHELNLPSVVVTFDPLAKEYFAARLAQLEMPARLSLIEHRAELLMQYGVDNVVCLTFDDNLASQTRKAFVDQLLIEALNTRYLVIGDDFRFGYQRLGDFKYLQKRGEQSNFNVVSMETFKIQGNRVSSGRVRDALADNQFDLAKNLLGREFSLKGNVSQGQQLGQKMGFPTANVVLPTMKLPFTGVYIVKVCLGNVTKGGMHSSQECHWGVANLGNRPTVDGVENRLEVHILDLALSDIEKHKRNKARQGVDSDANYDLYGLDIEVFFVHKIRDEQKFADIDVLKQQIDSDVGVARGFIRKNKQ